MVVFVFVYVCLVGCVCGGDLLCECVVVFVVVLVGGIWFLCLRDCVFMIESVSDHMFACYLYGVRCLAVVCVCVCACVVLCVFACLFRCGRYYVYVGVVVFVVVSMCVFV